MAYVYAYTVAGELWYIGKGSGQRSGRHLRRAKRYAKGFPEHVAAYRRYTSEDGYWDALRAKIEGRV